MSKKVLIIEGGGGGASVAARLRRLDEEAHIVMFERDEHISFANFGLPYYIGDLIKDRSKLIVQTLEAIYIHHIIQVLPLLPLSCFLTLQVLYWAPTL